MWRAILLAICLAAPAAAAAAEADEREAVLAAMDKVLRAQNRNDAEAYAPLEMADGMTYAQAYRPGGKVELLRRPNSFFLARLRAGGPLTTELYWKPTVMIRRDIAAVWTAYSFDADGKRSHCGYDLFEFVRVDGEWKIANAMWTIEPDACPELERGVKDADKRPR
jgi:hypothetical protein